MSKTRPINVIVNGKITKDLIWDYNKQLAKSIVFELGVEKSKLLLSLLKEGEIK